MFLKILPIIIILIIYLFIKDNKKEIKKESKKDINIEEREEKKEELIENEKKIKEKYESFNGWWNNVVNCEGNGNNYLYCSKKKKWVFPY